MKRKIYNILKGKFLVNDDAFKNWRMILFLSVLALIMIASSHSADRKVHEVARLKDEVRELHSRFVEGRSELMGLKKETVVEHRMKEKGIFISEIPPTKIKVKSKQ